MNEIIESLKKLQLYKAVQDATFNYSLYSLGLISENEFVPQLTIESIIKNKRIPAIAYRFNRNGIIIGDTFFPSSELLDIYKDSCTTNGQVWIPIKHKIDCKRVYFCIKQGDCYDIRYQGTILECRSGQFNPNPSLVNNEIIANQTSDYWINVSNICDCNLHPTDLISVSSKKSLSYSFTGSQPIINCL